MMRHISMTDFDDAYYIHQVKIGQTKAFAHIVRRYQGMVYTIVNKITVRRIDTEDIVQEIFIKVFQSLDKFRENSKFSTWLYRIAYNTTISELRKRKYEFTAIEDKFDNLPDEDIHTALDSMEVEKRLQHLESTLKKLSPDDALLISLFYMDNQNVQNISAITGYSVANVKVKLYRIRKLMNLEINKLIEYDR